MKGKDFEIVMLNPPYTAFIGKDFQPHNVSSFSQQNSDILWVWRSSDFTFHDEVRDGIRWIVKDSGQERWIKLSGPKFPLPVELR